MTHDQAAADRERIAGEMKSRGAPACLEVAPTIDAALRAFEVLCEPRGWEFVRGPHGAHNDKCVWYAVNDSTWATVVPSTRTGNHAADVCRLVCEVLDREANPPENQCPECRTLMVRSGRVWKCLNCGTEKEPKHGT